MLRYVPLLVFLIAPKSAFTQTDMTSPKVRKSSLQLGVGAIHSRMIDEGYTDSELLFRGTNTAFFVGYGRETDRYIFNFSLNGSVGNIESKSGGLPSRFYFGAVAFEYLRKVRQSFLFGKQNDLFGGVALSTLNQGLYDERVIVDVTIFSLHGVYVSIKDKLKLNEKQSLQFSCMLPAMVYENRLLWNSGASKYTAREVRNIPKLMVSNGEWSVLNLFENVRMNFTYVRTIGNATDLQVGYRFFYAASDIEAPLHTYSNELLVGFKFRL